MADLMVSAYRNNRAYHLNQPDYSQVVRDEEGQPPVKDRADQLVRELAERSHRSRLGWVRFRITPA